MGSKGQSSNIIPELMQKIKQTEVRLVKAMAEMEALQKLHKSLTDQIREVKHVNVPTMAMDWTGETEKDQRLEQLKIQKEFNEMIVNTSLDLIGVYDSEMRIVVFNRACELKTGLKKEEVIGKKFLEVFPTLRNKQGYKDLLRALKGEAVHNRKYVSELSGRVYENFLTPLTDSAGNVYAALVMAHDYTDLLQSVEASRVSEEKFTRLFQFSPYALMLAEHPGGKIVEVNDHFFRLTGYSRKQTLGRTSLDLKLYPPEEREKILKATLACGSVNNVEVMVRRKTGQRHPALISIQTITLGQKHYFLKALIDIADLKDAEHQLEQKNIELQVKNKELQAFAYVSSHDLQEPLRKIHSFAGYLMETEFSRLTPKGQDFLNRMRSASNRMKALIEDLLAFSRLSATDLKFEKTDLDPIVQGVLSDLQEIIEQKQAKIHCSPLPTLSVIPFQFGQLIQNLLSNSLKFSREGKPPDIHISARKITPRIVPQIPLPSDALWWEISVKDNGIGFDNAYKEKIFEVFQRLHGKLDYEGTGIGLSIVKKIVENHHGFLAAASKPNKGAQFYVYLRG